MHRAFALLLLGLFSCAHHAETKPEFDRAGWVADLDQLEGQLGHAYANLAWNVDHRGLDLAALDHTTRVRLAHARTDREAFEALSRFLGAFGDPHLEAKPEGQPWAQPRRYAVRFRTDGREVVIGKLEPGACAAAAGDRVERLEGRAPLEWVALNRELSSTSNPALTGDDALLVLTNSPFAPERTLTFTAVHEGKPVECALQPHASAAPKPGFAVTPAPLTRETPGEQACERLGASAKTLQNFDSKKHPELEPLPGDNAFFAGILRRPGQGTLGWLRIGSFLETHYPRICAAEWNTFRQSLSGACDEDCQDEFLGNHVGARLAADVAKRLAQLDGAHVSAVVLDISDNGGGTDWAMDVARLLAHGPLECPAVSGVRGPHWAESIEREAKELGSCPVEKLTVVDRERLTAALADNADRLAQARAGCDLSPLFHGGPRPDCTPLISGKRHVCELPPRPTGIPEDCRLFGSDGSKAAQGLVHVPVFVLVNRLTASASEELASILQDNHAATIVGERTLGAGCGFTNGGIPLRLVHSGLKVRVPDCARFRLDGRDETEGVLPDRPLPWSAEDFARWQSFGEKALSEADRLFEPSATPHPTRPADH